MTTPQWAQDLQNADAARQAAGAPVQHTRTPVVAHPTINAVRATCLDCGWSDDDAPHDHATLHVQSFKHRVMVTQLDARVYSIAPVADVFKGIEQ